MLLPTHYKGHLIHFFSANIIKAIIGIGVALVWITFFALAKAAGTADRRLEEIQRLSAEREAGVVCGN